MSLKKAIILISIPFLLISCGRKDHPVEQKPAAPIQGITATLVKSEPMPDLLEVVGTVRSKTSALVSPRIPGVISVMQAKEGDRVKKGDILASLDARENQANALAAGNAVEDAHRALDEALARKKLADTQFERYRSLFAVGAVSRQEFDEKETGKELALQGVARAEARLKQSREQAKGAGTIADYSKIIAPVSGIITSRMADLGATVFPGQPIFTVEDESGYQLELAIPESMASRVRPGAAVQISLDSLGSSFTARIADIVPAADPASRTFTAKVPLAQKGLKSGMFGRGSIAMGTSVRAIYVPKRSVVERGPLTSVWVVDGNKIARLRLIKVGRSLGDRVEILTGLSDGEQLVTDGMERLSEGAKVE